MDFERFEHEPVYRYMSAVYNYTIGCPPVRGDNARGLTSGLSYIQNDNHGITIL